MRSKQNSRFANATKPLDPTDFSKSGAKPGYQRPQSWSRKKQQRLSRTHA